ncbi:hypothetical protein P7K49_030344 [Saguinus oedipus]|uniref:Uncharacterized protein n=1 Tax=Saguinus oedipus TaxID=9490 RepID=A0ABQ9U2V7_SAGOE|nr:hypothetical protein P7K49_030344 [Saguinus oedipus]
MQELHTALTDAHPNNEGHEVTNTVAVLPFLNESRLNTLARRESWYPENKEGQGAMINIPGPGTHKEDASNTDSTIQKMGKVSMGLLGRN